MLKKFSQFVLESKESDIADLRRMGLFSVDFEVDSDLEILDREKEIAESWESDDRSVAILSVSGKIYDRDTVLYIELSDSTRIKFTYKSTGYQEVSQLIISNRSGNNTYDLEDQPGYSKYMEQLEITGSVIRSVMNLYDEFS